MLVQFVHDALEVVHVQFFGIEIESGQSVVY